MRLRSSSSLRPGSPGALDEETKKLETDPWGNPYVIEPIPVPEGEEGGDEKYRIVSYAADGAAGGEGADLDINSHELPAEEQRLELRGKIEAWQKKMDTGRDRAKDQSYYLFDLDQSQLARIEFPLGELTKPEVREHARRLGLRTAEKPESQEICFVPDGDYARVVEALRPDALPGEGDVVDETGRVLGRHAGIHRFTVGQRRGLGLSSSRPLYVKRIDAAHNRLVVAPAEDCAAPVARLERVHWIAGEPPAEPVPATVQVRYRHEGAAARITPTEGRGARVEFEAPVRAVAPGQAAVFYQGDVVLGGGWIAEAG